MALIFFFLTSVLSDVKISLTSSEEIDEVMERSTQN